MAQIDTFTGAIGTLNIDVKAAIKPVAVRRVPGRGQRR
jgi:hypothetical protein